MKKSLIALAVAGTFAAPAFAATSNVDVYGKMRLSLDHVSVTGTADSWQLNDQTSRLGIKGSEDLGGGLKAIYQMETALGTASGSGQFSNIGGTTLGTRNTFIGLSGGFGTVLFGKHDTPYKLAGSSDLFADTSADSQNKGGIIGYGMTGGAGDFDMRATNAIAYVSPTMSGFHAAVAVIPGETTTAGTNKNSLADAYSLALVYGNGPLNVAFGYEDHNDLADESAWKLNAGYTFGDFKVGATYESQDGVGTRSAKNYLLSGAYGMGPITLALQYGKRNVNAAAETAGDTDLARTTLGAVYSLSKRTSAYVAYDHDKITRATVADVKANVWTMGLNHDF